MLFFVLLLINLNPVLGFHLFNGLLADNAFPKDGFTSKSHGGVYFYPRFAVVNSTTIGSEPDHLNPFFDSIHVKLACQDHCDTEYSSIVPWVSCLTGCTCDSFVGLGGVAINSCEEYCIEDRFPTGTDTGYTSYSGYQFMPYMQWFDHSGFMYRAGHVEGFSAGIPNNNALDVAACLDGCAERGVCNNPPTDAPTDAPPNGSIINRYQQIGRSYGGMTSTEMENLGTSVAGIGDIDGDLVNDIAIGTYDSAGDLFVLFMDNTAVATSTIRITTGMGSLFISSYSVFLVI